MSRPSFAAVIASVVAGAMLSAGAARIAAQGPPPPPKNPPPPGWIDPRNPPKEDPKWQPPRTPDGQPNIQGQWNQASDIITYSIEDPEADRAEHIAISGQRAMVGRPIIEPIDGKIPYQPWAAKYPRVSLRRTSQTVEAAISRSGQPRISGRRAAHQLPGHLSDPAVPRERCCSPTTTTTAIA